MYFASASNSSFLRLAFSGSMVSAWLKSAIADRYLPRLCRAVPRRTHALMYLGSGTHSREQHAKIKENGP